MIVVSTWLNYGYSLAIFNVLLLYRDYEWNVSEPLFNLGINEDTVLHFSLSSFHDDQAQMTEFCQSDITPSVKQTEKGLSVFFSTFSAIVIFYPLSIL